jgi:uncharacterized OB-fold protein
MADRFCRECGNVLRPKERFCPGCGKPVHETAVVSTPESREAVLRMNTGPFMADLEPSNTPPDLSE